MQWNAGYNESVYTFANTINTHEGGTHEEGFRAALTSAVNAYAKDQNLLKPVKAGSKSADERLSGDDIREGLTAIISVKLAAAAVRGPDEDEARQHRGQEVRPGDVLRGAEGLVRGQPHRGALDRQQGAGRAAGPRSPPARPAT